MFANGGLKTIGDEVVGEIPDLDSLSTACFMTTYISFDCIRIRIGSHDESIGGYVQDGFGKLFGLKRWIIRRLGG